MGRRKKKKRNGKEERHFSFAFLIAIPSNFALAGILFLSLLVILRNHSFQEETWAMFGTGFIAALAIIGTAKISKFRVFVHEIKHALIVVLTGNSLKNIVVGDQTGHVEYSMYENKVHFAPIIALAPYFVPLFSLPTLLAALIVGDQHQLVLSMALGFTYSVDLSMAYTDLGPHQSDLKKISGGAIFGLLYLAGVHALWFLICILWTAGGYTGFKYAALLIARGVSQFFGSPA